MWHNVANPMLTTRLLRPVLLPHLKPGLSNQGAYRRCPASKLSTKAGNQDQPLKGMRRHVDIVRASVRRGMLNVCNIPQAFWLAHPLRAVDEIRVDPLHFIKIRDRCSEKIIIITLLKRRLHISMHVAMSSQSTSWKRTWSWASCNWGWYSWWFSFIIKPPKSHACFRWRTAEENEKRVACATVLSTPPQLSA